MLTEDFIRVSQAHLINIHFITEIDMKKKQIIISTGQQLNYTLKYSDLCSMLEKRFKEISK